MAAAYKLKKMLDGYIEQMEELEQEPGAMTGAQAQEAAEDMKDLTTQIKKVAEEEPTNEFFGQELRDALGDENKRALDSKCDALGDAQDDMGRQGAAGETKEGLQAVSDAFEESQPGLLTALQKSNNLQKPGEKTGREAPRPGEREPGEETPSSAESYALSNSDDPSSDGNAFRLLKEYYPSGADVDEWVMQKTVERSGGFRVETARARDDEGEEAKALHIDPATLSPEYRDRIERYYKKLSEQGE